MKGERARAATPALGSPAPPAPHLYAYAVTYTVLSMIALAAAASYVLPVSPTVTLC